MNLLILPESLPFGLWPLAAIAGAGAAWMVRACVLAVLRDRTRSRAPLSKSEEYVAHRPLVASFGSTGLDVEVEALAALRQVDALAARNRVQLQIAVQPYLAVHADPCGFRRALVAVLEKAIAHAPCGKVMLGGTRHGGRIQIAVLDDGHGPDRQTQEAALRPVERIVALHGGTLQIEVRPGQGSLVILRLPEPAAAQAKPTTAPGAPHPGSPASPKPDLAAAH